METDQLNRKAKLGVIWNTAERIVTQGVQFVLTIVLARLLSPEIFGIVAMPTIFLALSQVFIDSGFANAIIRKPDIKEEDLSTAFYFNIIVGLICYFILFFLSPAIALFFHTPILENVLKITALVTLFNPLCIVQQAILTKKLNFKTQAYIAVASSVVSGVLGIWMAYNNYGIWSLVVQQVSASLIRLILLWFLGGWVPRKGWSRASFSYLWNYGSKVVVVGILDTFYNNIYAFVIGKFYNAKDLGNYSRSQTIADLPVGNLGSILQRVTLPLFSEIQQDESRLESAYLRLLKMTALMMFPLMLGISALSRPFILIVLGEKWEGCIFILQILCIARVWTPLNAVNINLLQVKGRTDLFLKVEIAKKTVLTAILAITLFQSLKIMMIGFAVATSFAFLLNTYFTQKVGVPMLKQIRAILPIMIISIIMMFIIILIDMLIVNIYMQMIVGILVGTLSFYLMCTLAKIDAINDLKRVLLGKN